MLNVAKFHFSCISNQQGWKIKNGFIPQDQGNEMYSTQSFNECAFVHFNGN